MNRTWMFAGGLIATLAGCASAETAPRSTLLATAVESEAPPACTSLDAEHRTTSPFQGGQVRAVERTDGPRFIGPKPLARKTTGARIFLHATPGMTERWLERVLSCQASARNETDPVAVPGASFRVHAVHGGFAIDVTADDSDAAQEVLRRAQALPTTG